jgi:hypothetical protein
MRSHESNHTFATGEVSLPGELRLLIATHFSLSTEPKCENGVRHLFAKQFA